MTISVASCSNRTQSARANEAKATSTTPSTVASVPPTATAPKPIVENGPDDAIETAIELAAADRAIHDPGTSEAALSEAALQQELAYRTLAVHPEWDRAVADLVPEGSRSAVAANVEAARQLGALADPAAALPAWSIVAPAPAPALLGYYREAQAAYGIPWPYLAAIHLVETRMGRIRGLSSAGARGPMQFMPATWATYGKGDIDSDRDSILAAARYLRASGGPGDMAGALYAYNPSSHYVKAVTLYAEQMQADPRAYPAYRQWQVFYRTTAGDLLLPEGWTGSPD